MEKKKLYILILAITLFLSSYSFAVWSTIPNGGFETGELQDGTATNWTIGVTPFGCTNYDFNTSALDPAVGTKHLKGDEVANIQLNYTTDIITKDNTAVRFRYKTTGDEAFGSTKKVDVEVCDSAPAHLVCGNPTGCVGCTPNRLEGDVNSYFYDNNATFGEKTYFICDLATGGGGKLHFHFGGHTGTSEFFFDEVQVNTALDLLNTITEPIQPIAKNQEFTIKTTVTAGGDNVPDATVKFSFNNGAFVEGTYSTANKWYSATFTSPNLTGDYNYAVSTTKTGDTSDYDEGLISVATKEFEYLTVTPINNILSYSYSSIDFVISSVDPSVYTIWRVDSNTSGEETPTYKWFNFDNTGRQYFVYTSSNGINWVFDATLTYGSTQSNPVQKIWDETKKRFDYSFSDTLTSLETKYYKLEFQKPVKRWESIGNSDEWLIMNPPVVVTDVNSLDYDEYTVSQYTGIRNIFKEFVPDISGDETVAYELQFTARADTNGTLIEVGQTVNGTDSGKSSAELTSTWHRYSFSINGSDFDSQILMLNSPATSSNIQIMDYALIPRGFFTKRLEIRQANGDYLPLFLLNGFSKQYLQEGNDFRITTGAYDRKGNIDELRLEGYFDSVTANNLVKKSVFDVYGTGVETKVKIETILDFDQVFPAIIDLNGTANDPASPRNFILKANIYDENGVNVAVQSQMIKFVQYPYFPNDLRLTFFPTEKRKGKNPAGLLEIEIKRPETLNGLDLRIYSDGNTIDAPNYRNRIYKNTDFTCADSYCSLQIKVDEYLFEDVNLTTITWFALMNTEYLDQDNNFTRTDRRIYVSEINFDRLRLFQNIERADKKYRNDEEIPLVLTLKDSEADNLKDKLNIHLTLRNCDTNIFAGVHCVDQTIQYKPTGFVYDAKTNMNYYYFRHLYVLDDGSLLPDGNYIGFRATIKDQTGTRTQKIAPLVDRCQGQSYNTDFLDDLGNLVGGTLGSEINAVGEVIVSVLNACQVGSEQYAVVTTTQNQSEEIQLTIDDDHSVSDPSHELFACVSPDQNNIYGDPLSQDLLCLAWYEIAESPIDNFRLRISNKYSDFSVKGSDRQYIEFNIPYEVIAQNDVQALKEQLDSTQDSSINTVGEFFYEAIRSRGIQWANVNGINSLSDFLSQGNLITNFGADVDLNQAFSSTTISGIMFYEIKGIPVVNAFDYSREYELKDIFENINRKAFLRTLQEKNISFRKPTPEMQLFVSDMYAPVKFKDESGIILIDEKPTKQRLNTANIDANNLKKFIIVPNLLLFNISNTMFYNNFSENEALSISMPIRVIIQEPFDVSFFEFLDALIDDPVQALTNFLASNLLFIMAIALLLTIGGVIYWLWFRG